MNVFTGFLLSLVFSCIHYTVSSDYSNRIVLTTSREDDPETWFDNENPQFEYTGQLWIGESRYIKAKIRQTDTKEKIRVLREDPNVAILRQKPEITWVNQEKFQVRIKRTSDPEWPYLWYLNDDLSPSMKVTQAWNAGYSGKGIVTAIVDDGVQTDHPDLSANIDIKNSISFRDGATDPNSKSEQDDHGTMVTGILAAVKDNNICIPGVAFNCTVIGIQLLGRNDDIINTVDSNEASALTHKLSLVDLYSNSWGPNHAVDFVAPEKLTKKAIVHGVTVGRNGKGAIYVFAAGNGGPSDNCNADGYANSIYTITITSVHIDKIADYAEVCAPALAATYGGGHLPSAYFTSTAINSGCSGEGNLGTSCSAPVASGIIAMTLESNPNLTWRDIQHLIVLTSKRYNLTDSSWSTNGVHKQFSQFIGYGLMDAEAMVSLGSIWQSVPKGYRCESSRNIPFLTTTTSTSDSLYIKIERCSTIKYLEQVEVTVIFSHTKKRGDTELYLFSPAGTKSNLLHYRPRDNSTAGNLNWTYTSNHFWGERSVGNWTLSISSKFPTSKVTLKEWYIVLHGTAKDPWQIVSYRVVFTIETTAYQSSNRDTLNDPSTTEFKDIKAGLERYWLTKFGAGFSSTSMNSFTQTRKGAIIIDHMLYISKNSVGSLVTACYDLTRGAAILRFGSISSIKASAAFITKDNVPGTDVVISNLTQLKDLCSIRSKLSTCSSSHKCKIVNGTPSCVQKESTSTANKPIYVRTTTHGTVVVGKPSDQRSTYAYIFGGVLGGLAVLGAAGGGSYVMFKKIRQKK